LLTPRQPTSVKIVLKAFKLNLRLDGPEQPEPLGGSPEPSPNFDPNPEQ
jgi:hypothetical protein